MNSVSLLQQSRVSCEAEQNTTGPCVPSYAPRRASCAPRLVVPRGTWRASYVTREAECGASPVLCSTWNREAGGRIPERAGRSSLIAPPVMRHARFVFHVEQNETRATHNEHSDTRHGRNRTRNRVPSRALPIPRRTPRTSPRTANAK